MNKLVLSAVAVSVITVGAGSAAMLIADGLIDQTVNQFSDQLPAPMTSEVVSSEGNFANRQVTLKIGMELEGQPISALLVNDIQNRPWGTRIQHQLKLDDSLLADVDQGPLYDFLTKNITEKAIVTGSTKVGLTGSYQTTLTTIAIDDTYEALTIQLSPWQVEFSGGSTGSVDVSADWKGMTLIGQEEAEQLNFIWLPMALSATGSNKLGLNFVGDQKITGEGVLIKRTSKYGEAADVNMGPYEVTTHQWVEEDNLNSAVAWHSDSIVISSDESNYSVSNLVFEINANGLDIEQLAVVNNEVNTMNLGNSPVPSPELVTALSALLQNGFSLSIPNFSAELDGSNATFDFSANLPENTVADLDNPFSLMGLIPTVTASANLSLDKTLLDLAELAEPINALIMMGMLVEQGDQFVLTAGFENGEATLNGGPMPNLF